MLKRRQPLAYMRICLTKRASKAFQFGENPGIDGTFPKSIAQTIDLRP